MINDPDNPDFRYPQVGERYYHEHWATWCTVIEAWPKLLPSLPRDEVPVQLDCGGPWMGWERCAVVKLRSLQPGKTMLNVPATPGEHDRESD